MTVSDVLGMPALITVPEAAAIAGVSAGSMYRQLRKGAYPSIKVGGTLRLPVIEFLEALRLAPVAGRMQGLYPKGRPTADLWPDGLDGYAPGPARLGAGKR